MPSFRRPTRASDALGLVVAVAALAAAVFVVVAVFQVGRTIATVSSDPLGDIGVLAQPTPGTGIPGMLSRGERVNVLLLGYGGAGHPGAYLTDSIMIVSLDPKTSAVTLISVPRDLWVTIAANRYTAGYAAKVNEAFAIPAGQGDRDEGMRAAKAVLEPILGLTIHGVVAVDFHAFRSVVDAIGGIDVTVDRSFDALYPRNDDSDEDPGWIEVSFKAGPQHMDGETALRFVRARYSDGPEGSDFARALRQQKVVLAAKDGVVAADAFTKLFGLLDALRDNVRTDLSLAAMQSLADFARRYDDSKTVRGALTTENVLQSGLTQATGYALWPKVEGWSEVQAYVRRALYFPASLAEDSQITVHVSAARQAAGENAIDRLADFGLRATLVIDTTDVAVTTVDGTTGNATASFLVDYFGGRLTTGSAAGTISLWIGTNWIAPREFDAPFEAPAPEASPTPTPTPSGPTPRPTKTSRVTPTPPRPTATPKR